MINQRLYQATKHVAIFVHFLLIMAILGLCATIYYFYEFTDEKKQLTTDDAIIAIYKLLVGCALVVVGLVGLMMNSYFVTLCYAIVVNTAFGYTLSMKFDWIVITALIVQLVLIVFAFAFSFMIKANQTERVYYPNYDVQFKINNSNNNSTTNSKQLLQSDV